MRKSLLSITMAFLVLLIAFGAGYFTGSKKEPAIKIVTETKTEYKTIKVPVTVSDLETAAKSPIEITGETRLNWLDVRATDGYKESNKSFKVGTSGDGQWNYAVYAGVGAAVGVGIGLYALLR